MGCRNLHLPGNLGKRKEFLVSAKTGGSLDRQSPAWILGAVLSETSWGLWNSWGHLLEMLYQ